MNSAWSAFFLSESSMALAAIWDETVLDFILTSYEFCTLFLRLPPPLSPEGQGTNNELISMGYCPFTARAPGVFNFSICSRNIPSYSSCLKTLVASNALGSPNSGSAPASKRILITSRSFLNTTPASIDWPRSFTLFGSAPCLTSNDTSGAWP